MKLTLIDNWKHGWKMWSVILGVFGLIAEYADDALELWYYLPDDILGFVPAQYLHWISGGLWGTALIARFIKQEKVHDA